MPFRTPVPTHSMQVPSGVRCLRAINGSSQLLSGSRDGSVKLWDIQAGILLKDLSSFSDGVFCLDAGYDDKGSLVGVGGSMDCSGRVSSEH
jgi:WD40 repeat protein